MSSGRVPRCETFAIMLHRDGGLRARGTGTGRRRCGGSCCICSMTTPLMRASWTLCANALTAAFGTTPSTRFVSRTVRRVDDGSALAGRRQTAAPRRRGSVPGTVWQEIDTLLDAARWAPSAGNSQPWALYVAPRHSSRWHQLLPCPAPISGGLRMPAPCASISRTATSRTPTSCPASALTLTWGRRAGEQHRRPLHRARPGRDLKKSDLEVRCPSTCADAGVGSPAAAERSWADDMRRRT